MRRLGKRIGIGAGALLGALLLVLLIIFLGANTGPGRALVTELVPRLTGGTVKIAGLAGRLPGEIRIQRLVLADPAGPWLTARNVTLDWRPLALLSGRIVVERLAAPQAHLIRLPAQPASSQRPSNRKPEKPIPLIVHRLTVERLVIGAALAPGVPELAFTASGERTNAGTATLKIDAHSLAGGGSYRLDASLTADHVALTARLAEPASGLLAHLMGLSLPGPLRLDANLAGPRSAIAIQLRASAGPLRARATGRIDLAARSAHLVASASAPAMVPRPGISWSGVSLEARLDGSFTAPRLDGKLALSGVSAAGAKVSRITASLTGSGGLAHFEARFSGITLPGPAPDLLAKAPLLLEANARLDAPDRPVSFTLTHPLISIGGTAATAGTRALQATIHFPDLTPLAAVGGVSVSGSGSIKLSAQQTPSGLAVSAMSAFALKNAPAPLLPLLGAAPRVSFASWLQGDAVTLSRFSLTGRSLSLDAHGSLSREKTALAWQGRLADLAELNQNLRGRVTAHGTLEGTAEKLRLAAQLDGTLGTATRAPQPFRVSLAVNGLPAAPEGRATAETNLNGAPLDLALKFARESAHTVAVKIERATWQSAHAEGALTLGPEALAGGRISFAVGHLGDLSSVIGAPIDGAARGTLAAEATREGPALKLELAGTNLASAGLTVANARLVATLLHPLADRSLDATLRLDGASAGGRSASAEISARGPIDSLALRLDARSPSSGGATLSAEAHVTPTAGSLSLSAMTATFRGKEVRLLAPARIVFSPGIAIAGLRLGMAGAELDASGRLSPTLALTLQLRNVTPVLIGSFLPDLAVKGRLDAEANLGGSLSAPSGRLRLHAAGIGFPSELTAGLPPANLDLTASLAGQAAQIQGRLAAGSAMHLAVSGSVPLARQGTLGLSIKGDGNLAALEPALAARGRRIGGRLALAATVHGPLTAPAIVGTAHLSDGSISDYESGLQLTAMAAAFALDGKSLRIRSFTAHAGRGTVSLAGSVGVLEPGIPVSLTVSADNAELLQSDLITARLDANLALNGLAERALAVRGRIHIRRAEIRIPSSLPPNIAVLNVVRPGSKPPPPGIAAPAIDLDVTLDAPREIFVRGRGVDAEFGGRIHVSGTTARPTPEGSFHLIRGAVSLAGQTLNFTSGTIGFNGGAATDPALDLVATTTSATTTATLTLGGTVRKPTVKLSSVPEWPQDQVLAALLFGTTSARLGPLQLAQIAGALASLTGAGPGIG
ncbi:MAG: translocation/assembly module TamB domain-containing protein, partial [Acetobacteraceae bacterium]